MVGTQMSDLDRISASHAEPHASSSLAFPSRGTKCAGTFCPDSTAVIKCNGFTRVSVNAMGLAPSESPAVLGHGTIALLHGGCGELDQIRSEFQASLTEGVADTGRRRGGPAKGRYGYQFRFNVDPRQSCHEVHRLSPHPARVSSRWSRPKASRQRRPITDREGGKGIDVHRSVLLHQHTHPTWPPSCPVQQLSPRGGVR
jgi:hypothetical protein